MKQVLSAIVLGTVIAGNCMAADVASVSRIAFGPDNVLFVADWKDAKIHALELPASQAGAIKPFNILDLSTSLAKALGTQSIVVQDAKARPGTGEVYVAVSMGPRKTAAIVIARADGSVKRMDLKAMHETTFTIKSVPGPETVFWGKIPERSLTVTDMTWHEGKLYVAGLSNQSFASTLRIVPFPFKGEASMTSIAMYHTSHDQVETRAPIRAMTIAKLGGKDHLIAAYMCTPLVTVPLDELKDGAHVTGKTIAELGYGNTPVDLITFTAKDEAKKTDESYVLLTNVNRNADMIALSAIDSANAKPSLAKPVPWSQITGVDVTLAPINSTISVDNLDDSFFITLRREMTSGTLQLVTVSKQVRLRLTDFVSEYDFPSYKYPPGMQTDYIKPIEDNLMKQEGFSSPIGGKS